MKYFSRALLTFSALFLFAGCETTPSDVPTFTNSVADTSTGESSPYEGKVIPGGVEIYELGTKITTLKSELPNVEDWKFVSGGSQVVIKSRAAHGPAAVQLYDVAGGVLKEKVMAFEIKDGKPEWAASYAE